VKMTGYWECSVCGKAGSESSVNVSGLCFQCARAELTRLRGIEAAVMLNDTRPQVSAGRWRYMAEQANANDEIEGDWLDAIADALEVRSEEKAKM